MMLSEDPTSDGDRAFCDAVLPRVSRTFALSIQILPAELYCAVSTSYLLCRIVDTIEDDPKIRGARTGLFDAFDAALAGGDALAFEQLALAVGLGPTEEERELVARASAVFRVYRALPLEQQRSIHPHIAEMSFGMRKYAARADLSAVGLRLRDLADLEEYCYYVAGTVGGLLTALFLRLVNADPDATWTSDLSTLDREAWLRDRARSFGLGLQMVNILKDVASDFERGDCFLPEALAKTHGLPLALLLEPGHRRSGLALIRSLCRVAGGHLDRATEYTLAWPVSSVSGISRGGETVRRFCAVPLALAYATLREVEEGSATLYGDRAPTVSKALVQAVLVEADRAVGDDAALKALFQKCKVGGLVRSPRPKLPNGRAASHRSGAHPTLTKDTMQDPHPLQNPRAFQGKVFVTGAAGHLGANLLYRLLSDHRDVRVLLLPGDNDQAIGAVEAATGQKVERTSGDLRELATIRRAIDGCETAFHVAARVSTTGGSAEDLRDLYACNVLGTANLLQAAREAGVKRVVVTGSFSAVGYDVLNPSRPSHEAIPFFPFEEHLPYGHTKVLVEHECLKAVAEGQDVVIATSCAVLGPWDYLPSRMGRTLLDFAHGRLRAYIPGGFEFVAGKDVANGHLLAMSRGRTGQRYILSSEFATVDELMEIFEEVSGRRRPRLRLPAPVMAGIAEVSSYLLTNLFPKVPQRFTPGAVRILRMQRHADISKAKTELGYVPTTVRAALHEAYAHFAERGLVPPSPTVDDSRSQGVARSERQTQSVQAKGKEAAA